MRALGLRFWLFLGGQAASGIGSWATLVAIWGYAAYAFEAGAAEIALIGVAWLAPPVVFGPIAGVPIDRFGPRPVLVAGKALGAVASVALVFADSYHWLVAFSVGHGIAYAFIQPALDAIPPQAVPERVLARANALLRVASDLAIVVGPVAAGASIALWDYRGAFVFDALTYLIGIVSAYALILHPRPAPPEAADAPAAGVVVRAWREALEGLRVVAQTPGLRRTVVLTSSVYFLYGAALLLEPVYVRDVLGEPVQTFAYLQSAFGIFLVGGGLIVARVGDRAATFGVLAAAVLGSGLGMLVYLGTGSLVVAFAGVMGWGAVTAMMAGPSRTLLQRHAPPGTQGRVLALDHTAEGAGHLAALPVVGALAAALGVQVAAVLVGGAVAAVGVTSLVRTRRAVATAAVLPVIEPPLAEAAAEP